MTVSPGCAGSGVLAGEKLTGNDVFHLGDVLEIDPPVLFPQRDCIPLEVEVVDDVRIGAVVRARSLRNDDRPAVAG